MNGLLRVARALGGVLLALAIVVAVVGAGLTWRLAQGPLDVTPLAQRLAARYAPEVRASRVTLAWAGFDGGPHSLHLVAEGVALGAGAADRVAVALSFSRLIEGRLEPTDFDVDGLRLHATRQADGQVVLDGMPQPAGGPQPDLGRTLEKLVHVSLHDARLGVTDAASGRSAELDAAAVDLRRDGGGIMGAAELSLAVDDRTITASLHATRDAGDVTRVQADISPASPASLAHLAPALAPLAMLDAPVTLHGQAELGPDLALRHAALQASVGEGVAQVPAEGGGTSGGTSRAHFAAATLDAAVDLRRDGGGDTGAAELSFAIDGRTIKASLHATRDAGDVTRVQADISPVSPASLAHLAPGLAPLAMLDAPVTLHAKAELGPDLALRHAALQASVGEGVAQVPAKGGGTSPAHFAAATLDAEGDLSEARVRLLHVVLAPESGAAPTNLTLSATLRRSGGRLAIKATLDLDRVAIADMPSLWPPRTGGGARPWLVENATSGELHDGHFTLTLEGSESLDDLDLTAAAGTLAGDEVTLFWLRPLPPIEHAQAVLTLESPDALVIVFSGARQGRIVERAGNIRITGLADPHQFGLVTTDLAAPVPDLVKLLSYPKLEMLSAHPLPLGKPTGEALAHLTAHIPLEDHVEFDDVAIHVTGSLTNLHVGGLVAGRSLDRGTIAVEASNDGLRATGTALLANIAAKLEADMNFRASPAQVTQHVAVSARADQAQLAAAGLDTFKLMGGTVAATLDYAERRDGRATVRLDADLAAATFDAPIGWSKPAGTAGFLQAQVQLANGRLVAVDRLRAEAPGLSIESRGEVVNGRPAVLRLDRLVVGRTSASGSVRFPAQPSEPIRIMLSGPRLDLSSLLDKRPGDAAPSQPDPGQGQLLAVDLRFGEVLVKRGAIGPVSLTAEGSTSRLKRAQLHSGGAGGLQASLAPMGGTRHLSVTAADLGAVLHQLDVSQSLDGGRLTLDGTFDDTAAGSPFAGTVDLDEFRIKGAPIVGKILQGLTLYGLWDALRGPGLVFDRLRARFRRDGPRLQLEDGRAFSSSLGLTADGEVNLDHDTLAIEGTIVPAYALNALPGALPLVGRLFSPERGGGVFAATFGLHGLVSDPQIGFNPLAALTPGFMRGVFGALP